MCTFHRPRCSSRAPGCLVSHALLRLCRPTRCHPRAATPWTLELRSGASASPQHARGSARGSLLSLPEGTALAARSADRPGFCRSRAFWRAFAPLVRVSDALRRPGHARWRGGSPARAPPRIDAPGDFLPQRGSPNVDRDDPCA